MMTQVTTKTINSRGIAQLLGYRNPHFAGQKTRRDPTFPRPVSMGTKARNGAALWALDDILAWIKTHKTDWRAERSLQPQLDNRMAQQIIRRGWKRGCRAIAQLQKQNV